MMTQAVEASPATATATATATDDLYGKQLDSRS
jgi:hypothetical protein